MPSKYFPFDSTFTGVDSNGIPQGDRGASSADWAAYVSRMFTDGYLKLLDDQLTPSISATPMAIDIAAGSAMIKGRQYSQDETVTVSLGLSDSQARIDRIVLRMSTEVADRKISLVVLKGTPGTSPVAPELTRSASVFDICLAQIAVGANAIQIVADNLTDTRNDEALCGYVKLLLDGHYYPDGNIPELLWVYTVYPETLTTEQKSIIEGDAELMEIYEASPGVKLLTDKYNIGDLKFTMSTSLGPKWRLCNGDLISADQYPDYVNVAKSNPAGLWKKATIATDTLYTAAYGNGYWVAGGTSGRIYYATDPLGTWTSKTIGSSGIFNISYIDGYWVAFTYAGTGKIYYCSGAPTGTWTAIDPPALSGYQWGHTFLKYVNGYWVMSYYTKATTVAEPYYGIKYRTTLPIDGTWLDGTTATIGNDAINDITYGGGYWVLSTSLGRLNYSNQAAPTGFTANLQSLAQNYGKVRCVPLFLSRAAVPLWSASCTCDYVARSDYQAVRHLQAEWWVQEGYTG